MPNKKDKLKEKGVITGDLPEAHAKVIEDLTDDEIDTIVSVTERLNAADAKQGGSTDWVSFIRF